MLRISPSVAPTFDDVLLLPGYSEVLPAETSLRTRLARDVYLTIPLLAAAMDTVTEAKMAIAMAQEGGIGVVHKNMTVERQAAEIRSVKKFESRVIRDPVTIAPERTVGELIALTRKHGISGVPVVFGDRVAGIVTSRDFRFETRMDAPVSSIMTPRERLITVPEGSDDEDVLRLLQKHRLEKVLMVDREDRLLGMVTLKDINGARNYPCASRDTESRLRVAAAVGIGAGTEERIDALVGADVDVLVVDTAHGYSQGVLDRVSWISTHYPDVPIIAGNVATAEGARALADAGADAVKVGVGPGSICTTRVVTGVGVPQITAVAEAVDALRGRGIAVIADGGIRYSGDLAKIIVAGADCAMIGNLFAGTDEAPGAVELYQGSAYKVYRGMGSLAAMTQGSSDRYFQDSTSFAKLVPEGVEGRVPYRGGVGAVIEQLLGGLRSAMGYTGCPDIQAMQTKPLFTRITPAGVAEGHVHDVTVTKEAPNYPSF